MNNNVNSPEFKNSVIENNIVPTIVLTKEILAKYIADNDLIVLEKEMYGSYIGIPGRANETLLAGLLKGDTSLSLVKKITLDAIMETLSNG